MTLNRDEIDFFRISRELAVRVIQYVMRLHSLGGAVIVRHGVWNARISPLILLN